ncbi:MAG: polyphenol oxidase family protein [Actinomycetota bacterium]|nr:polyphenol oxidase family protein [Actinomycetota bacterium]
MPWLEAGLDGATVRFTGRRGGVSQGPFESLNLGILTEDDPEAVVENRHRLAGAAGFDPERVAMGRQVHGAGLAWQGDPVTAPHFARPGDPPPAADGQLTDLPGLGLLVLVADCLPVALRGPGGLAMLHCGWRGLAAGIIAAAAARIGADEAVIGPGIGPCCFEVGPEVTAEFADLGPGLSDGRMLDLPEVAERLLGRAGTTRVERAGICTWCDEENFFSHRRDRGVTGRQAGIAWLD